MLTKNKRNINEQYIFVVNLKYLDGILKLGYFALKNIFRGKYFVFSQKFNQVRTVSLSSVTPLHLDFFVRFKNDDNLCKNAEF